MENNWPRTCTAHPWSASLLYLRRRMRNLSISGTEDTTRGTYNVLVVEEADNVNQSRAHISRLHLAVGLLRRFSRRERGGGGVLWE